MKTRAFGEANTEEPLLDTWLGETLRGVDWVTPKRTDYIIGFESIFDVLDICFTCSN